MVCRRMGYTKWAIDTTTVFYRTADIMMLVTKIRHTTAVVSGLSAAFVTLPSDVLMPVNLTVILTAAYEPGHTLLTKEVFFPSVDHFVA